MEDFSTLGHLPSTLDPRPKDKLSKTCCRKNRVSSKFSKRKFTTCTSRNEGLLRSEDKKKLFFEVGQRVCIYTPRTRKGLSKRLMHNWLGPNRVIRSCHLCILRSARFPIKTESLFRVTQVVSSHLLIQI